MRKVFVTTINFNRTDITLNCLETISEANLKGIELHVIVVDNASDRKFEANRKYGNFRLKIIRSEKNLGFAGGHNLAIKNALSENAEVIVVLNNDTLVDKDLFINLLKSFYEKKGIVSPKIYFAKGHEFHKRKYTKNEQGKVIWFAGGIMDWKNVLAKHRGVDEVDNGQFDDPEETQFATGCCMAVKREVFEAIGYFDEKYFLYYEDNDFSQRARREGFGIYYQPEAKLWHLNAESTEGSGSSLQDYYITRNRLLFGSNYAPLRTKLALLKEAVMLLLSGRKWQKKGVRDFFLAKFGKGSYEI